MLFLLFLLRLMCRAGQVDALSRPVAGAWACMMLKCVLLIGLFTFAHCASAVCTLHIFKATVIFCSPSVFWCCLLVNRKIYSLADSTKCFQLCMHFKSWTRVHLAKPTKCFVKYCCCCSCMLFFVASVDYAESLWSHPL